MSSYSFELEGNDLDKLLLTFFNTQMRLIKPIRRKVEWSKELHKKIRENVFDRNTVEALYEIDNKLKIGANVNHHLSELVYKKIEMNDHLLSAYKIHHLHLNLTPKPNSYILTRANYLLLCVVFENICFLVDIVPHRDLSNNHKWLSKDSILIIKNNWTELFDYFQLSNVKETVTNVTDEERFRLSKFGINAFFNIDGGVAYPMGGGVTTSGHPREAADRMLCCLRFLEEIIEGFESREQEIKDRIKEKTKQEIKDLYLKLILRNNKPLVCESNNFYRVYFDDFPFDFDLYITKNV